MSIKIGILGYGNLARGVECAVNRSEDMELAAVATRREPDEIHVYTAGVKVIRAEELPSLKEEIDVLILWRKCNRSSGTDAEICRNVQCNRQL